MNLSVLHKMRNTFFPLGMIVLSVSMLHAGDSGGQAGAFLRIGLTPRARSLGDAYVAIADNASAAYYNPAGLGFLSKNELQMSLSSMSYDRVFNYAGYSRPLPPMAGFAAGVIQAGFKDYDARLRNGERSGESISDDHYSFFIGFAVRFSDYVSAGISPKIIYSKIYDVSASSFGADFGIMVKPRPYLSFGAVLRDIGVKMKYSRPSPGGLGDQTTTDRYPRIIKTGMAYTLPLSGLISSLLFTGDLEFSTHQPAKIHAGVETCFQNRLWFRIGLDHTDLTTGFSFPFHLKKFAFRIDYAYIHDTRGAATIGSQDLGMSILF